MFYSFQDLGFAFGWSNVEKQLIDEASSKNKYQIEQRRSITGTLKIGDSSTSRENRWKIRDLSGWTNTSLKDFASSLGIPMENKDLLDDLKSSMDVALKERTKTFLDYGLSDVMVLEVIYSNFLKMVNQVLSTILNLPDKLLFNESNLPLATGALVAKTFEKYIFYEGQKDSQHLYYDIKKSKKAKEVQEFDLGPNSGFYLACWALSLFQKDLLKRNEYMAAYNDLFESEDVRTIFEKSIEQGRILNRWAFSSPVEGPPYSGVSIETLSQCDWRISSLLNCLVAGGGANRV